jgi:hypothetical protein
MHLKRYKTKLGYKYMILESGTNTCLVNLGCVSLREAQSELRKWSTKGRRQAAIAKYHLQDETYLFTDYLKEYVTHYLPAKAEKTITSELEAITRFKKFILLPIKTGGFGTEYIVADTGGGQPCNDGNGMRKLKR